MNRKTQRLYKQTMRMLYRPITGVWIYTPVVAIYRLGLDQILTPGNNVAINLVQSRTYGILYMVLFVAMLYAVRTDKEWVKKLVLSYGCGLYAMNAFDVLPVLTAATWNFILALIMFFEYSGGNSE